MMQPPVRNKPINQTKCWKELEKLAKEFSNFSIANNLKTAPKKPFFLKNNNVYFDYSKTVVNQKIIAKLIDYAESINLNEKIEQLFIGQFKNESEKRQVLHPAIRGSIDDEIINQEINKQKQKMNQIVVALNNGEMRGFSGRAIQHLVHIGVGGSEFGVQALLHGLYQKNSFIQIHFISSLDGLEFERLLENYPIDQMIFVVVSKSFTTEDTLNNANLAKKRLLELSNNNAVKHHFIGVSMNKKAMSNFGIDQSLQLSIWDWLSGRYSSFSAVGLALAVNIGMERFNQLLAGARTLDIHFRKEKNLAHNLPVLMALINFWHFSFLGHNHLAIFPYDALLKKLPMHLQQLIMESLGKKTNTSGKKINYPTSPLVMGDLGTCAQHAFYQLLYQGEPKLLAHFILTAKSKNLESSFHKRSQLHALVQSFGLSHGKTNANPNKHYPGNLPIIQIAIPEVSDFYFGYLIAMYEQMVFTWSVLLDINAFDQWGVEYGKMLAKSALIKNNKIEPQLSLDYFSNQLIDWINEINSNTKKD